MWARFKSPKEETLWYYRQLANAFQRLLPGQLADELIEIVIVLEKRVSRTHSACDLNVNGRVLLKLLSSTGPSAPVGAQRETPTPRAPRAN